MENCKIKKGPPPIIIATHAQKIYWASHIFENLSGIKKNILVYSLPKTLPISRLS